MEAPERRSHRLLRIPVDHPNPDQLELAAVVLDAPESGEETIQEAFERFHRQNPKVYDLLVRLAFQWYGAGHSRCAIGMLFEVVRWQFGMRTEGDDFKLNNNFRSRYVRKIMREHPELDGFFETRELHAP